MAEMIWSADFPEIYVGVDFFSVRDVTKNHTGVKIIGSVWQGMDGYPSLLWFPNPKTSNSSESQWMHKQKYQTLTGNLTRLTLKFSL
jgi:hypothetical protein